jgi:hypothetical protein
LVTKSSRPSTTRKTFATTLNLYNKRACPTKKEPQQGFLYLTIKMYSFEKFKSNAKTSTSTGIFFLIIF